MSDKNKIVALLTGRGNNTLPNKNILPVKGKPLLYYPCVEAFKVDDISEYYVSSDDEKILDAAGSVGYKRIKRPDEYALPDSKHVDCLIHGLKAIEDTDGIVPEILVVLMANCATIKSEWIVDCISMIKNNDEISAVVPVIQDNDHHPFRAKRLNEDGFLDTFVSLDKNISTNRQDLPPNYFLCHNFWVLNVKKCFNTNGQPPWDFMGDKVKPYVVDYSLDVHYEEDIYLTEKWIEKVI